MLKAKIKVSHITNLTDARYFAAWGVDYFGYDINPDSEFFVSPPVVKEISGWIEGPHTVLEVSGAADDLWIANYQDALGNVFIQAEKHFNELPLILEITELREIERVNGSGIKHIVFVSVLPWNDQDKSNISILSKEDFEVYYDAPFEVADIDEILSCGFTGFVLRGGEEERVGVKSYEDLDEIFEALMSD